MTKHYRDTSVPENWDRQGLPGWCYKSHSLLNLEIENVFLNHWQIICHVSDLKDIGEFITFDFCNERVLVLRDDKNKIQAFYNLCRHRGSRVVAYGKGKCKALVCPFHGWVYNLDGSLRGPSKPGSFPKMDKKKFGLKKLEVEIWNGLIFTRFHKGPQPSIQKLMEPFAKEIACYKLDEMIPTTGLWTQKSQVNWKSVRDVDNEGYHVPMAHPSLQDLYGETYFDEPFVEGVSRSQGIFSNKKGRKWSVKNYKNISQPVINLPKNLQKAWNYYGIFPNAVIALTPETMQFYQEFPLSINSSLLRGSAYRYKHETRQQKLARKLCYRIDRDTIDEDVQLTIWSNESMSSKAFEGFYLSDLEYGLKTHHDHLRRLLPVISQQYRPEENEIPKLNAKMLLKAKKKQ